MKEKPPRLLRRPVQRWEYAFAATMLIGMVVAAMIDECYVLPWLGAVTLASPVLVWAFGNGRTR